ncbi:GTP-binding protein [Achromobacter xylosoxidans]
MNIEGTAWVIQGLQHVFHPPFPLNCWPTEDQASHLVFITRGISESAINGVFAAVGAISKTRTYRLMGDPISSCTRSSSRLRRSSQ